MEARVYAMTHIAVLNAISSNTQNYSKVAAVAQAAHDVLVNQFPDGASSFDSLLAGELASIQSDRRNNREGKLAPPLQLAFSRLGRMTAPPPPRDLTFRAISRVNISSRRHSTARRSMATQ